MHAADHSGHVYLVLLTDKGHKKTLILERYTLQWD